MSAIPRNGISVLGANKKTTSYCPDILAVYHPQQNNIKLQCTNSGEMIAIIHHDEGDAGFHRLQSTYKPYF